MKKILVVLGVSILLCTMPIFTAIPNKILENTKTIQPAMPLLKKQTISLDEPPEWANGNFTGVWGINILGVPLEPLGWIAGYYQNIGLGNFAGVFGEFNDTNATGALVGFMLWIFFLGGVGDIETGNGTYVSGLGIANETHYYVRLSAIIGPSFYIHVKYTDFRNMP
jgi:hypothetical protein